MSKSIDKPVIVIPNLNGGKALEAATLSLLNQSLIPHVIIVDNASTDDSLAFLKDYPQVELIKNDENEGYTGGVNPGFLRAIEMGAHYTGPFNDDAIADNRWLESLVNYMDTHPGVGAAAPKVLLKDKKHIDSTGEFYTIWGLAYPRGRGEVDTGQYDHLEEVFAASGAACLYRVKTLREVGVLDQDFFAYYEDVDLSFRMRLAGWKIAFVSTAIVYHSVGMTSGRIKGFTTYQTMKNTSLTFAKNIPKKFWWRMGWRFMLVRILFLASAIARGNGKAAIRGDFEATKLLFKKRGDRKRIQTGKKVSDAGIWKVLIHDLPPDAHRLRALRARWWKIIGKKA